MSYVDVGSTDDVAEGRLWPVRVNGRAIVITRWRGRLFALRNICPHQTQQLDGGYVVGSLGGLLGQPELDEDRPMLVCPAHHWKYDATTGRCVVDRRLRIGTYEVQERNGRVLVDTRHRRGTESESASQERDA